MKLRIFFTLNFIFLSLIGFAQIQYFPTTNHDLDGDSIEDFVYNYGGRFSLLYYTTFDEGTVKPNNGAQLATSEYHRDLIEYLEFNDSINSSLRWLGRTSYLCSSYLNYPREKIAKDYFFGIRIKKNDSFYYGWIRFQGETFYNGPLDAAVQLNPDIPILAGEGIASIQPIIDNVYETFDEDCRSELFVKFYSPYYNSLVDEYRFFVLNINDSIEISIEDLLSVPDTNYQKVEAGKRGYYERLNTDIKDINNKVLLPGEKYRLIILSISNKIDSFQHSYSLTAPFTFKTFLSTAGTPVVLDANDEGNSKDLTFSFERNSDEALTQEYRIMILPADSSALFNLENAAKVMSNNYFPVSITNDSVYNISNILIPDIYGKSIEQNKPYKSFIYSVQDSNYSNIGSLSSASNTFCLAIPDYFYVGQTMGGEYKEYKDGLSADTSSFDIDKDGQEDLSIVSHIDPNPVGYKYGYIYKHTIDALDNTEIIFSTSNFASNCTFGEVLEKSQNWGTGKYTLYFKGMDYYSEILGEFNNTGNIGFRKISLKDTIYGWINLTVARHEFNHKINNVAWQKRVKSSSVQIPDLLETSFLAYPNPNIERNLNIAIENFEEGKDYFIDVLSLTGSVQSTTKANEKLSTINLANLQRGIYYIRFHSPDKHETQKIIVL